MSSLYTVPTDLDSRMANITIIHLLKNRNECDSIYHKLHTT